jgi:hypothetical protein
MAAEETTMNDAAVNVRSTVSESEWEQRVTHGAGGGLAWPALLRKLDRLDAAYRS